MKGVGPAWQAGERRIWEELSASTFLRQTLVQATTWQTAGSRHAIRPDWFAWPKNLRHKGSQLDVRMNMADPVEDRELARQRLRLWVSMLKSVRSIETELRGRLRSSFDTTLPRFDVLAALHAAPQGLTMTDLSQQLMVSNGNVTGIVDRLVADGMALRQNEETTAVPFASR